MGKVRARSAVTLRIFTYRWPRSRGLTRRSERYNWVPGEEKNIGLGRVLRRVSGVKPAQQRPFRAAIVLRGFRRAASRVAGFLPR